MRLSLLLAMRFTVSCAFGIIVVLMGGFMLYQIVYPTDWVSGFALSMPLLLLLIAGSFCFAVMLLAVLLFRRHVLRRLRYWCIGFPAMAVVIDLLFLRPFWWQETCLIALTAAVSSLAFYWWNKKRPIKVMAK